MAKEVEVTETKTNTFRLFNKIEYNPVSVPESWGIDATFWVRPMTNTERAVHDFDVEEVNRSRGLRDMVASSGVTKDDYEEVDGKQVAKKSALEKMAKAVEEVEFDVKAEQKYLDSVKKIIVDCTEKASYDGDTMDFTEDVYEALNGSTARAWLLNEIEQAGTLTGAERIAL